MNDIEYDDEYDDTYDENAMGEAEPDALELGREFVLPRALGGGHIGRQQKNESGDDDENSDDEKPKLDFVRNPEEVRAEAERKRQSKVARHSKNSNPRKHDVVGNAKGQGQDKQVLINRARKNANKNKQHRQAADKKQSKGMF